MDLDDKAYQTLDLIHTERTMLVESFEFVI